MLDATVSVAPGSRVHSSNFILNNFPSNAAVSSTEDNDSALPGAGSLICAPGSVKDAS